MLCQKAQLDSWYLADYDQSEIDELEFILNLSFMNKILIHGQSIEIYILLKIFGSLEYCNHQLILIFHTQTYTTYL